MKEISLKEFGEFELELRNDSNEDPDNKTKRALYEACHNLYIIVRDILIPLSEFYENENDCIYQDPNNFQDEINKIKLQTPQEFYWNLIELPENDVRNVIGCIKDLSYFSTGSLLEAIIKRDYELFESLIRDIDYSTAASYAFILSIIRNSTKYIAVLSENNSLEVNGIPGLKIIRQCICRKIPGLSRVIEGGETGFTDEEECKIIVKAMAYGTLLLKELIKLIIASITPKRRELYLSMLNNDSYNIYLKVGDVDADDNIKGILNDDDLIINVLFKFKRDYDKLRRESFNNVMLCSTNENHNILDSKPISEIITNCPKEVREIIFGNNAELLECFLNNIRGKNSTEIYNHIWYLWKKDKIVNPSKVKMTGKFCDFLRNSGYKVEVYSGFCRELKARFENKLKAAEYPEIEKNIGKKYPDI